jgi:hypothetical protein
MSNSTSSITQLVSVTNELEASAIVAALAAHGIKARHEGGYTAGFLAEAPGEIQVLVLEKDLARATEIVESADEHAAVVDWSAVDCGDPEPLSDKELDDSAQQEIEFRPLQVSLKTLLVIQTTACVLLAISRSELATVVFSTLLVVGVYAMVAFGIVQIGSKRERANELLRFCVSSFVVLSILLFAMRLF